MKPEKAALFLLPCFPYLWSHAALFGAPYPVPKWLRKPIQEAHFAAGISGSWNPSSAKIRYSTMRGEVPVAYTLFLKPLSFNFNQGHALKIGAVFRGRIYDQPSLFTQGGVGAGFFYQHPFFECLFNPMAQTPVPHSFDLSFRFPKLPRFLSGLQGVIHPQAFYAEEVEGKERSQLPIYPFSLAPVLSFGKHGFLRGIVNLSPETLFHQAIPSLEVTLGLKVSGENSSSLLLGLLPNSFLSPSGSPNLQAAASDAAQGDPCETLESTEVEAVLPDSTEGFTNDAPPSSAAEPPTVLSQPPGRSPKPGPNGGPGNLPGARALASLLTPIPRLSGVMNPSAQPLKPPQTRVRGTGTNLVPTALPASLPAKQQGSGIMPSKAQPSSKQGNGEEPAAQYDDGDDRASKLLRISTEPQTSLYTGEVASGADPSEPVAPDHLGSGGEGAKRKVTATSRGAQERSGLFHKPVPLASSARLSETDAKESGSIQRAPKPVPIKSKSNSSHSRSRNKLSGCTKLSGQEQTYEGKKIRPNGTPLGSSEPSGTKAKHHRTRQCRGGEKILESSRGNKPFSGSDSHGTADRPFNPSRDEKKSEYKGDPDDPSSGSSFNGSSHFGVQAPGMSRNSSLPTGAPPAAIQKKYELPKRSPSITLSKSYRNLSEIDETKTNERGLLRGAPSKPTGDEAPRAILGEAGSKKLPEDDTYFKKPSVERDQGKLKESEAPPSASKGNKARSLPTGQDARDPSQSGAPQGYQFDGFGRTLLPEGNRKTSGSKKLSNHLSSLTQDFRASPSLPRDRLSAGERRPSNAANNLNLTTGGAEDLAAQANLQEKRKRGSIPESGSEKQGEEVQSTNLNQTQYSRHNSQLSANKNFSSSAALPPGLSGGGAKLKKLPEPSNLSFTPPPPRSGHPRLLPSCRVSTATLGNQGGRDESIRRSQSLAELLDSLNQNPSISSPHNPPSRRSSFTPESSASTSALSSPRTSTAGRVGGIEPPGSTGGKKEETKGREASLNESQVSTSISRLSESNSCQNTREMTSGQREGGEEGEALKALKKLKVQPPSTPPPLEANKLPSDTKILHRNSRQSDANPSAYASNQSEGRHLLGNQGPKGGEERQHFGTSKVSDDQAGAVRNPKASYRDHHLNQSNSGQGSNEAELKGGHASQRSDTDSQKDLLEGESGKAGLRLQEESVSATEGIGSSGNGISTQAEEGKTALSLEASGSGEKEKESCLDESDGSRKPTLPGTPSSRGPTEIEIGGAVDKTHAQRPINEGEPKVIPQTLEAAKLHLSSSLRKVSREQSREADSVESERITGRISSNSLISYEFKGGRAKAMGENNPPTKEQASASSTEPIFHDLVRQCIGPLTEERKGNEAPEVLTISEDVLVGSNAESLGSEDPSPSSSTDSKASFSAALGVQGSQGTRLKHSCSLTINPNTARNPYTRNRTGSEPCYSKVEAHSRTEVPGSLGIQVDKEDAETKVTSRLNASSLPARKPRTDRGESNPDRKLQSSTTGDQPLDDVQAAKPILNHEKEETEVVKGTRKGEVGLSSQGNFGSGRQGFSEPEPKASSVSDTHMSDTHSTEDMLEEGGGRKQPSARKEPVGAASGRELVGKGKALSGTASDLDEGVNALGDSDGNEAAPNISIIENSGALMGSPIPTPQPSSESSTITGSSFHKLPPLTQGLQTKPTQNPATEGVQSKEEFTKVGNKLGAGGQSPLSEDNSSDEDESKSESQGCSVAESTQENNLNLEGEENHSEGAESNALNENDREMVENTPRRSESYATASDLLAEDRPIHCTEAKSSKEEESEEAFEQGEAEKIGPKLEEEGQKPSEESPTSAPLPRSRRPWLSWGSPLQWLRCLFTSRSNAGVEEQANENRKESSLSKSLSSIHADSAEVFLETVNTSDPKAEVTERKASEVNRKLRIKIVSRKSLPADTLSPSSSRSSFCSVPGGAHSPSSSGSMEIKGLPGPKTKQRSHSCQAFESPGRTDSMGMSRDQAGNKGTAVKPIAPSHQARSPSGAPTMPNLPAQNDDQGSSDTAEGKIPLLDAPEASRASTPVQSTAQCPTKKGKPEETGAGKSPTATQRSLSANVEKRELEGILNSLHRDLTNGRRTPSLSPSRDEGRSNLTGEGNEIKVNFQPTHFTIFTSTDSKSSQSSGATLWEEQGPSRNLSDALSDVNTNTPTSFQSLSEGTLSHQVEGEDGGIPLTELRKPGPSKATTEGSDSGEEGGCSTQPAEGEAPSSASSQHSVGVTLSITEGYRENTVERLSTSAPEPSHDAWSFLSVYSWFKGLVLYPFRFLSNEGIQDQTSTDSQGSLSLNGDGSTGMAKTSNEDQDDWRSINLDESEGKQGSKENSFSPKGTFHLKSPSRSRESLPGEGSRGLEEGSAYKQASRFRSSSNVAVLPSLSNLSSEPRGINYYFQESKARSEEELSPDQVVGERVVERGMPPIRYTISHPDDLEELSPSDSISDSKQKSKEEREKLEKGTPFTK